MVEQQSRLDSLKLLVALAIALGAIVGYYYYSEYSHLLRVIGILCAGGLAFAILLNTALGNRLLGFAQDSRTEVRKVVWPTRAETVQTTLIVLVVVVLVAIALWAVDSFLFWAIRNLTGQGG